MGVMQLVGRTAVVTGGGSGIGEGLAKALAAEGCKVVVADILMGNGQAVVAEIERSGGIATAIECDVSERSSVRAMKSQANRIFGPVSMLFANAGVTSFEPLTDMADEDIDWLLQVNLNGVFHCIQTFLPDMIEAREGHIVATSSFAGILSSYMKDHAPYVAAKAGVIGLMLTMRRELAEYGIGSTVVCPGKVTTSITESPKYKPARFGGPSDASVTLPLGAETQVARTPAQVAQMVLQAMREDRGVVVTHGGAKDLFSSGYADLVLQAFDDAARWEAANL